MLTLRKILLCDPIYYFISFLAIIYFVIVTNSSVHSLYKSKEREIRGTVIKYNIDGNLLSLTIKGKEKIVATYYLKTKEEKETYINKIKLGIKLNLIGTLEKPINNTIPNTFNYKKYLNNQKIFWLMRIDKITLSDNNPNLFYDIKNYIAKRINPLKSNAYLNTFILGNKNDFTNVL